MSLETSPPDGDPNALLERSESISWWSGLQGNIDAYDLIICDLWGVIHNGLALNSAAVDAILAARKLGKKTIFLTNAPRPRSYVREQLHGLGLPDSLLDLVVTSGGLARDTVRQNYTDAKLYHMGPDKDKGTVEGLPVTLVKTLNEAEVILATDRDFDPIDDYKTLLQPIADKQVPLLCANPDKIVHVGDRIQHCAGAVADIYETLDGPVEWFGKPTPAAFEACMHEAGFDPATDKSRTLVIGDSVRTDIRGANQAGLDSLLLTQGIHRDSLGNFSSAIPTNTFLDVIAPHTALPSAVTDYLRWS